MAKTQAKPKFWKRLFGWFGRHKVTAVFSALVLAIVLFFAVSDVVLQVQIHFERARFVGMDQDIDNLSKQIAKISSPQVNLYHNCSYTSNGAVFATRFLGCGAGMRFQYLNVSRATAAELTNKIHSVLSANYPFLKPNDSALGKNDLAVYVFDDKKIGCGLSSTYYDEGVPAYDRYDGAVATGKVAFMEIDCSGPARAEYFPVTDN